MFRTAKRYVSPIPYFRHLVSASSFSLINPNSVGPFQVFDRNAKRLQKDRAALHDGGERSRTVDYVRDEVADRMMERFTVSFLLAECACRTECTIGYQTEIQQRRRFRRRRRSLLKAAGQTTDGKGYNARTQS